jgi:potassium uptake TrkH family protein
VLDRLVARPSIAEHPARFVVAVFVAAILTGAGLLLLPWSTAEGSTGVVDAIFTSTSAICVTGLAVVDTGTHWSHFGQLVILVLIQLGGLGFMTMASLVALVVSRRLGLRMALITSQERSALTLGDVRRVLRGAGIVTVSVELAVAVVLFLRFRFTYDYPVGRALWHSTFHAVSAFNNAGFGLYADSLMSFAHDEVILAAIGFAIVVGGLGFPVLVDLYEHRRRRRWGLLTLHSRITLVGTAALLSVGFVAFLLTEWTHPGTLGPSSTVDTISVSLFNSITPRTAGFNAVDYAQMSDEGLLVTMLLMFVGAGSAGTSGGIKVGTTAVLALVVWAQVRGTSDVVAFRRRISETVQREATTVVLLAVSAVIGTTVLVLATTGDVGLVPVAFESVSAFGTVGLSMGITPSLPEPSLLVLSLTMLVGRVGPITLGMALVLRRREARYRHPEEAPLIG